VKTEVTPSVIQGGDVELLPPLQATYCSAPPLSLIQTCTVPVAVQETVVVHSVMDPVIRQGLGLALIVPAPGALHWQSQ
jgi:hypothetical protein